MIQSETELEQFMFQAQEELCAGELVKVNLSKRAQNICLKKQLDGMFPDLMLISKSDGLYLGRVRI